MELVVARTRKERKILHDGEVFLGLLGLTLQDIVEFRNILRENESLVAANTRLLKENKRLKGESNEGSEPDEEHPDEASDIISYLGTKESVR